MIIAQAALYIFAFTFIMYMAYRVLWLVFFLFAFRFWEMILNHFSGDWLLTLTSLEKFFLLVIVSFITYLAVYLTTMKMPIVRYLFLAVLVVAAIRVYSVQDILFFKDYFVNNGMWSMDYWIKTIKDLFSISPQQVLGLIDNIINVLVSFFSKMFELIRGM